MWLNNRLIPVLLILLFSLQLRGGEVDESLRDLILVDGGMQKVPVIIKLRERYSAYEEARSITDSGKSLSYRHQVVISRLKEVAVSSQESLLLDLKELQRQGKAEQIRSFWIDNLVAVHLDASGIESLSSHPAVEKIYPDYKVSLIGSLESYPAESNIRGSEIGLRRINAHLLWELGVDGEGSIVMNIDSGVDGTHPALASRWHGNFVPPSQAWFDPSNPMSNFPTDNYWVTEGHGTHTMGTMCGLDGTDTIGVAPGAHWIAAGEFFDESGQAFLSDVIAAFQWGADPDGDPSTFDDVPDVISNSWGLNSNTSPSMPPCDDTLWEFIDNAEAAGAAVVFAAGNEGQYGAETIRRPADRITTIVNTMAVGAVDASSSSLPIAYFSSRGPSGCDHQTVKPEVVAPGVGVRSSVPGGGYEYMSGTSMACPHVAGAIALLRQVAPMAPPEALKEALYNTAIDLGAPGEDNSYGNGFIDVYQAALSLANGFGQVAGTVTDSATGQPIPGAIIHILPLQSSTNTDENGSFSLTLPSGDYLMEVEKFEYFTRQDSITILPDTILNLDISLERRPTGTISGVIRDKVTDVPVFATMDIYYQDLYVQTVVSDSISGYFLIALPGDSYRVFLHPPLPYPDEVEFTVEIIEGTNQEMNIELEEADILIWSPAGRNYNTENLEKAIKGNLKTSRLVTTMDQIPSLSIFKAVFVLLGVSPNNVQIIPGSDEEYKLMAYLNTGGNLYLEGGDFWSEFPEGGLRDYFFINAESPGTGDLNVIEGDDFTGGLVYEYADWADNDGIDRLSPLGLARVIHRNDLPRYVCGVAYDGGNYKTIGNSFNLGGLESEIFPLDSLLGRYFSFFGLYGLCLKGDLNGDGEINVIDVVSCINIIMEINDSPDEQELCAGDYDDDGSVDITDVIEIIHQILIPD